MSVPAPGNVVVNQAHVQSPYVEYALVTDYLYRSGTMAIPVAYILNVPPSAGVRQQQEIVQLSQPYGQRIVTFTVARRNLAPVIPAIDTQANERLFSARVSPQAPILENDGFTRIYRVTGQYVYDQFSPVYPGGDTLDMGANVADNQTPSAFTVEAGQYQSLASRTASVNSVGVKGPGQ